MRRILFVLAGLAGLAAASPASAQTGFYLPAPAASYGQDEFRSADGTTCRSTMDGTKRVELGAFGSGGRGDNGYGGFNVPGYNAPSNGNAGVYGRFSMSLDATPDRMDCNALFRLELEKRRLEVEMLKRSISTADAQLDAQMRGEQYSQGSAAEEVAAAPTPAVNRGKAVPAKTAAAAKPSGKVAAKRGSPPP